MTGHILQLLVLLLSVTCLVVCTDASVKVINFTHVQNHERLCHPETEDCDNDELALLQNYAKRRVNPQTWMDPLKYEQTMNDASNIKYQEQKKMQDSARTVKDLGMCWDICVKCRQEGRHVKVIRKSGLNGLGSHLLAAWVGSWLIPFEWLYHVMYHATNLIATEVFKSDPIDHGQWLAFATYKMLAGPMCPSVQYSRGADREVFYLKASNQDCNDLSRQLLIHDPKAHKMVQKCMRHSLLCGDEGADENWMPVDKDGKCPWDEYDATAADLRA